MHYKINDKNEIKIYNTNQRQPFLLQPSWPDGSEWESREEAVTWAELLIESLENPQSEYLPGRSPEQPKRLRPDPIEIDPETGLPVEETQTTEEEK